MRRAAFVLLAISHVAACAESTTPSDASVRSDFASIDDLSVGDMGGEVDQQSPDLPGICDLGAPPDGGGPARLFVAATTSGGAPYVALHAAGTWTTLPASGGGLLQLVGSELADRPLLIGRQTDEGLTSATFEPCAGLFPTPAPLFALALTAERPAVVGGSSVEVVFRGSISGDQRLYATHYDGSWQPALTLGNFLSTLPPVALRTGGEVHVIFTGTDGSLYDGLVNGTGGAATPIGGATSDRGPGAVVGLSGSTYVVWKASDTNLSFSVRPPGGAYSTALGLCNGQSSCLIASNELPVVALDRSGAPVAAWIGKDDGIVYTSRLDVGSGVWSAPLAASAEATALPPALAPGLADADLELVYVRSSDGQGRHARLVNGVFSSTNLPAGVIGSRPSLVRIGQ